MREHHMCPVDRGGVAPLIAYGTYICVIPFCTCQSSSSGPAAAQSVVMLAAELRPESCFSAQYVTRWKWKLHILAHFFQVCTSASLVGEDSHLIAVNVSFRSYFLGVFVQRTDQDGAGRWRDMLLFHILSNLVEFPCTLCTSMFSRGLHHFMLQTSDMGVNMLRFGRISCAGPDLLYETILMRQESCSQLVMS